MESKFRPGGRREGREREAELNSEPKTWFALAARTSSLELVLVLLRPAFDGHVEAGMPRKSESIAWEV